MRAMMLKEFRELRRDHRTVGMLVMMPLLLLVVFGYAANFSVSTVQHRCRRSARRTPWQRGCPTSST